MTPIIIALLLSPTAPEPALVLEEPEWAFVVPSPAPQPASPPVAEFLAELDAAATGSPFVDEPGPRPATLDEIREGEAVVELAKLDAIVEGLVRP